MFMDDIQYQISEVLEDKLFTELFVARCNDIGEAVTVENAKIFKEDLVKRNMKNIGLLNLHSMRLGVNCIVTLSNTLNLVGNRRNVDSLNLADNAVTD